MAIPATQIRRGMVIVFEGDPCRITEFRHHTPGNLRAMVQAKLKNLRSGSNFEQLEMDEETLGDGAKWMQPGMKIVAEYYNGRPIAIDLPNAMELEIIET